MSDQNQNTAKPILCNVTSDKMDKSRVAVISRKVKDGQYGKFIRKSTRLMFHDENNESKIGDRVLVKPSRPKSANKKFDLVSIVEKA